ERSAAWSTRKDAVEARQRERLGALMLSDRPWPDAPPEALAAALTQGIRAKGIAALPWPKPARLFQARICWLAHQAPGLGLPDCSDAALSRDLEEWLTPHLAGMSRIGEIARLDLTALLGARLDWSARQALDQAAPAAFTTPLGRRIAIDYGRAQPAISLKVQEMFGQTAQPTVGAPPVPLMIELLSPAGRPVQTTSDLPGFWASSYRDVAKEMRARYPKHPWPDNPGVAAPTDRARRRSR
ncbi:MAG: ATP-dependent helicase C-terminal domain-containing protein, partial [Pseudomonadota bacterium]